ncbi:non-specific serine/threonine protein kinase [Trifolium repens]|nr:non-specific serine/threonine protein kinase [Trifolium repens]
MSLLLLFLGGSAADVLVITERLFEEEIGGLKELFRMLDADNSGAICSQSASSLRIPPHPSANPLPPLQNPHCL